MDNTLLSTNTIFLNKIKVYPTVCTNYITIEPEASSHISVYDLNGKLVDSFRIKDKTEYSTGLLKNGIYVVRVWSSKGIESFKIVKR